MTIENLAVWSLYPDWADGIKESLEFLTTVAESPFALEQRRGLRLSPRQSFEYSYVLKGPDRTHFDLLTMRSSGSPIWLPLWHEVELLKDATARGDTVLHVDTIDTEIRQVRYLFIGGNNDFELAEITAWEDTSITVSTGLANSWPKGTRIVPIKKCRVDQQPSTTRHTELVSTSRVRFISLEKNLTDAASPFNLFGQQYVLEDDPNEVDDLSYNYERVMSVLDNTMGLQYLHDVTERILQQFAWWAKGRAQLRRLRGMFYALDGRRVPVWVPTIYSDFEAVEGIHIHDAAINVKRCGFTELGGPTFNREYILIYARSGERYYRKIVNSVIIGDGSVERLILDTWLDVELTNSQILRISFLVLSRLDQDSIEFQHHTATRGMTTAVAVFRSASGYPGIENTIEIPPTIPPVQCLSEFNWFVRTPDIPVGTMSGAWPDRLDRYGNQYIMDGLQQKVEIYNTDGVLLNTVTPVQLGDAINGWHSGAFHYPPATAYYSIYLCPIRQGQYVIGYVRTASTTYAFDQWWVLMEPAANGSLTVKGAVYNFNLVGPPYSKGLHVFEVPDTTSAIIFQCYFSLGSDNCTLAALPSISDFLAGTYTGGFEGGPICRVPNTILYPIGNKFDLGNYLYSAQGNNMSRSFGFRLPGNGRQLLYIYFNRSYLDYVAANPSFVPLEIKNVVQPASPLGAMLQIPLGNLSYSTLSGTIYSSGSSYRGRTTEDYSLDNGNWGIPFTDEFHYLSDGTSGGHDCYSPQVSTQPRANGHHWVIFVMAGVNDYSHADAGHLVAKIRVFDYNPLTEAATQVFEHICILHTDVDIPTSALFHVQNDYHIIAEIVESDGFGTVVLHAPVYRDTFARFAITGG